MTDATSTRLPGEWEPQAGVQLTWPHGHGDWRESLEDVERCFAAIAREVSARELLLIACEDGAHTSEVLASSGAVMSRVRLYEAPSDDSWARDHAPVTVLEDGRPVLLDFVFNGWGGKFGASKDNALSQVLHAQGAYGSTPLRHVDFVFEGGSIESDGAGTLLTTTQCLLTPTRNPDHDMAGIEARLLNALGGQRVLWLHAGLLEGDDTDGHIDTLARFCDPHTIAYTGCDAPHDPHYEELGRMEEELRALRTLEGEPYRLMRLPLPAPQYDADGWRLPATYANFLIIDGAVLVPTYEDPDHDAKALEVLEACFPERDVVGIDCRCLIAQHGSLHCVTMQFPAGVAL